MKFLMDVSALISLGVLDHEFHQRTVNFLARQHVRELATCAITELGFTRVLAQAPQYGLSVAQARDLLRRLKSADTLKFTFIADSHDATHLPAWVRTAKQVTDGHLMELARAHGAVLATHDRGIPGAVLIPA